MNNAITDQTEPHVYTVGYRGNGHTAGTPPADSPAHKSMTIITLPGQGSLVKEGFVFNGWNTTENGGGTTYSENDELIIGNANVLLYARWLHEVAYTELVPSNVSVIDILNVLPLPKNEWHYASVDLVHGSLTLRDGINDSQFQFRYNPEIEVSTVYHGLLGIRQNNGFYTATEAGKVLALPSGSLINTLIFEEREIAEISGPLLNWQNKSHVYIPASITVEGKLHFGYIEVSYNDKLGQLTIHATAYNRVPNKSIKVGDKGS